MTHAGALGRIAIIGAGQVGTALGIALRTGPAAADVTLHDRNATTARRSRRRGAADRISDTIEQALTCDVVMLAVPVEAIIDILERHGPSFRPGSLVIDTGSVKRVVVQAMARALGPEVHAIGGHPLAGTERPGPAGADPAGLSGAAFALCPVRKDPRALRRARALVRAVGARPFEVDAAAHDRAVARTIGLPHLLAFALHSIRPGPAAELSWSVSSGFRGATRLAASDPTMVASFLAANAPEIRMALRDLRAPLALLERRLGDERGLARALTEAVS